MFCLKSFGSGCFAVMMSQTYPYILDGDAVDKIVLNKTASSGK